MTTPRELGRFQLGARALVLFDGGRVELLRDGAPSVTTTDELVLGWPEDLGVTLPADTRAAVLAEFVRRVGASGCRACGGPLARREVVKGVHPVSGDGYGLVQTRCLECGVGDEWPFSDN